MLLPCQIHHFLHVLTQMAHGLFQTKLDSLGNRRGMDHPKGEGLVHVCV